MKLGLKYEDAIDLNGAYELTDNQKENSTQVQIYKLLPVQHLQHSIIIKKFC